VVALLLAQVRRKLRVVQRVVHAVVQNVCRGVSVSVVTDKSGGLQNANAPLMIPFATAVGKIWCARAVNGACSAPKSTGGITRRRRSMGR
jgi:hypothetical protein